ncbi:GNAT family N-acetyltransferase [Streptomyces piniterrae]|uniref:GNAT family N-acetyltransferase n=1 Tax=Streptomyces piniterrae TaxID=2571125 RepID=A0A4U0MN46_9ACTN|nr:GNAT family N-acetyltransferase [Streptomyces piniterrae]TJZ41896.1 GNAT family N-acetyltransferase [Streptomyces piniterrae]
MTTTLRPAGPEERQDGGGRARPYDVCVNSRRVGRIRLATDARFGPAAGRIEALEIDPPDRHRGRATVAALAAEEVLRGWGCRRIELTVPAAAEAALRLAAALGYTERSRRMAKEPAPSQLPAGSQDRPLGEAEFPAWFAEAHAAYVSQLTTNGMSRERAERISADGHRAVRPDGVATPDHVVRILAHDGVDVGHVWVAMRRPGEPGGYVMDVKVDPAHRGRGHGRTLMLIAERECLAAARETLGLNVYTDNAPALKLYDSLGYRPTGYLLWKPIL